MSLLQVFQPCGRHVQQLRPSLPLLLLLLFSLFWLPAKSEDGGCPDPDQDTLRGIGEQWLLPDCGGVATCKVGYTGRSYIETTSCPGSPSPLCPVLEEGDLSAKFPRCCPRLSCSSCHSEKLDRDFAVPSTWTEGHCVQRKCRRGPSGSLERYEFTCEPLGPPPSLDCEVVEQDMSRGEYPLCCAYYRCPGLCKSGDSWRSREIRGDSCDRPEDTSTGWLPWN